MGRLDCPCLLQPDESQCGGGRVYALPPRIEATGRKYRHGGTPGRGIERKFRLLTLDIGVVGVVLKTQLARKSTMRPSRPDHAKGRVAAGAPRARRPGVRARAAAPRRGLRLRVGLGLGSGPFLALALRGAVGRAAALDLRSDSIRVALASAAMRCARSSSARAFTCCVVAFWPSSPALMALTSGSLRRLAERGNASRPASAAGVGLALAVAALELLARPTARRGGPISPGARSRGAGFG